jgi:hypothetical protein
MKLAATILTILTLVACSSEDRTKGMPTTPTPFALQPVPTPTTGFIWGFVIEKGGDGSCIAGATVEIIDGVRQGESQVQKTPCGVWDYGDGFEFDHLPLDSQLTLRASAPGYASKEFTARPVSSGYAIDVGLSKLP